MKVDIRNSTTEIDTVQFADEKDNFFSRMDSMDADYATEVSFNGYAGHRAIQLNGDSFLIKDWDRIKAAVELLIKEQSK
jgi:hypothetical protein